MAAALRLRDVFTTARMRALARSSRVSKQVRRLLALATIYKCGSRGDAAQFGGVACRRIAIGFCGSTPPLLMASSTCCRPAGVVA